MRWSGVARSRVAICLVTLVAGAGVLGWVSRLPPGDDWFAPATAVLAAIWATGALAVGGLPWRGGRRVPGQVVARAAMVGGLLVLLFLTGAVVAAQVRWLRVPAEEFLDHAYAGSLPVVLALTLVTGAAEELFFRGALFGTVGGRHGVLVTTVVYTAVTAVTGIVLLVLAAAVLGLVVGLQRRAGHGLLAPVVTHLTWSVGMLVLLPPVFAWAA